MSAASDHSEWVRREYTPPFTVEEAHALGRMSGYHRKPQLTQDEFFSKPTGHQFPRSLWNAYESGYRIGARLRSENDVRRGR